MNWIIALLVAFVPIGPLLPAPSTPVAAPKRVAGVSTPITFAEGSYVLHVPPGTPPDGGWPWIMNDHGAAWNGAAHEAQTGMSPLADEHGFVVMYGNGQGGTWDAGPICCAGEPHRDDVAWHRAMVADASTRVPLRATGYAMGGSNGGMMAWRLACDAPDLIISAVVVAGTNAGITSCRGVVVKILRLHGTDDVTVPFCEQPTTQTPYPSCTSTVIGKVRYWHTEWWVGTLRPGSLYVVEMFDEGHTWTPAQSTRAMSWFLNEGR